MKYIGISVVSLVVTFILSDTAVELGYAAYKETLAALLNISSIIFAIIGAWIAIIYPRAIGRVFKEGVAKESSHEEAISDAGYLSELVEIVLVSAVVLMFVLSIQFLAPVVRAAIGTTYVPGVRYALFYLVTALTMSQLYAVSRVILANFFFLNQLRRKNTNDRIESLHK